jgi:hypothetical protein
VFDRIRPEPEDRAERAQPAPAPPLPALQRAAGNRAVTGHVTAARLPAGVRGKMERAFDSSFEDVRVYERSGSAAALGAQAVTAGSGIHFAPGAYAPGTSDGDALIGHELAHVVQQRQGRARATLQTKGLPLSVDTALEREADTLGARAARGERTGSAPTAPVAGEPSIAQAKFGFEFQTGNSFVDPGVPEEKVVGEKQLAFEDTAKKFKVEGDEGYDPEHFDVEFITAALTTVEEAKTAIEGAAALAADLGNGPARATRQAGDGFDGGTWKRTLAIEVTDKNFRAKPQASVGVALADIPWLMQNNLYLGGDKRTRETVERQTQDVMKSKGWKTWRTTPALQGFLQILLFYIRAAGQKNWVDDTKNDPEAFPSLGYQVLITDGPKARFSIMARTDFHSMFKSLDANDQRLLIEGLLGTTDNPKPNPELAGIIGAPLADPMINGPYRADKVADEDRARFRIEKHADTQGKEHEIVITGPTILDWLLSVVTGKSHKDAKPYADKNRDMLSAPVGWGSRAPDATGFPTTEEIVAGQVYGMGAYPIDDTGGAKLAVFELRNFNENLQKFGMPPAAHWWDAAAEAFKWELKPGLPQTAPVK